MQYLIGCHICERKQLSSRLADSWPTGRCTRCQVLYQEKIFLKQISLLLLHDFLRCCLTNRGHRVKMRVLLFWSILIASKTTLKMAEVHETDESKLDIRDFTTTGNVVPGEVRFQIRQYDMLKGRLQNAYDYVRSIKTRRSTRSELSNDTLLADSLFSCKEPSWVSCLGRCSREWDFGPTVARLQCFCDYYCEMFMDCCADYDKHCSTSSFLAAEDTTLISSTAKQTLKTALVQQSTNLSPMKGTALFTSNNVTSQVLTSSIKIIKSLHISPSPSYERIMSHQTSEATLKSGFPKEQLSDAPDERWNCVQDGHANETVGVWMIAACPKQWPADLTKKKCEQPYSLSVENYNDMIPVSDQGGTNYKNRHCARCAEVKESEIIPLELDITCTVTPPQHFSRSDALKFLFKYCPKIQWKARDGKHRRYCKTLSSSCQTSSPHYHNCKNGTFRIIYDAATRKNYKNLFCAKCYEKNRSKFLCGPKNRYTERRQNHHKFNVLLDVLDTTKSGVAVSCPLGQVYDVHLEICRKAAVGVPIIADFDKYHVILWVTSPQNKRVSRKEMLTSLIVEFNLEVTKVSLLYWSKAGKIYIVGLAVKLGRNQANLTNIRKILAFTHEVTIQIHNASFTIFKVTSRLINCEQIQQIPPSLYTVDVRDNEPMIFLKATKEILRPKDYYTETTEIKDGVLIPKGNITVCGQRIARNCSGMYISLDKTEYVTLPNGTLYRNASNGLYSVDDYYVGVNKSVWICSAYVRTYLKEERRDDLSLLAPLSIAGLSMSVLFLLIVLVTYLTFSELRAIPGLHLANLSFSLLLSHLLWLLATLLKTSKASCTALAVFLHYFFLVSFAWMSIIAYDTWRAFSCKHWCQSRATWRQMRARVVRHMTVGWIPALIFVIICVALDQSNFASFGYGGNTGCWISNRVANLCVFTTPVALSMAFNIIYFLRTIQAIRQTKRQTRNLKEQSQKNRDFPIFAKIAALMGFSWLFGFLAMLISKYLWYPFVVLTTLQGVYIAIAFVFSVSRVRKLYHNLFTGKRGGNTVNSAAVVGTMQKPSNRLFTTSAVGNVSDLDYHRMRTSSETQL